MTVLENYRIYTKLFKEYCKKAMENGEIGNEG